MDILYSLNSKEQGDVSMENTINELYSKYTEQVEGALEDDRYFQYLFETIQAGDNTLEQKHRVLHKVVDERWLGVVEEGIQSIFNIVDKPRRFIATTEEVVPVALAKKITADSVRHLSQNTQFITMDETGEIQPTKILNVTTEESYDLYENRFIYHLIQRLFAFVDKRTDVIFWSTGDETCNVMSMESKIDDAYEEISYKVEMTIKNRQSYEENDMANMDLFKRIDRVRRLSRTLRTSSFCDIMNGCAKVRSPIQRTNLMMKDPDYRACYKLWQFIESYDEVGYTIEEQDSALEFDEEYLLQMYINMITNYTVFKSLLESDPRKMSEIAVEKREPVKPKFIKEIKEEIVDDYNIPDVEVRQIIIEEVTQAQLDAEAKLEEETKHREELERSVSDLEWQLDSMNQQLDMLNEMQMQLEEERAALEGQLASEQAAAREQLAEEKKARKAVEDAMAAADIEARNAIETARKEAKEAVESAQNEKDAAIEAAENEKNAAIQAAEQAKTEAVAAAENEKNAAIAAAENEKNTAIQAALDKKNEAVEAAEQAKETALEEARRAQEERESALKEAEAVKKTANAQVDETERAAREAVEKTKEYAENAIQTAQDEAAETVEQAQRGAKEAVEQMRREAAEAVEKAQREAREAVERAEKEAKEAVARAQKEAEEIVAKAQREAAEAVEQTQREASEKLEQMQRETAETVAKTQQEASSQVAEARKRMQSAEKAKEKAIAKAEANSLSHYIVQALQERRDRKNNNEDEK